MDSRQLRAGVIGLGWAGQRHLACFADEPGVQVVAVTDLHAGRRAMCQRNFEVATGYEDWRRMLAVEDLDLVSIATPTCAHAPIAIAALRAGCHVLCEKPAAANESDANLMHAAAIEAGRVLLICFNYRKRADVKYLKNLIDQGALGEIYSVHGFWTRLSGIPALTSWYTSRELSGGGVLADIGTHILDLMLYLAGEPSVISVSAAVSAQFGGRGLGVSPRADRHLKVHENFDVEDTATAFLRLAGGGSMVLEARWACFQANRDTFGVVVRGTAGGADLIVRDYSDVDCLRIFGAGSDAGYLVPSLTPADGHKETIREFLSEVRNGRAPLPQGVSALRRSAIIDACYLSAATATEVQLTETSAAVARHE